MVSEMVHPSYQSACQALEFLEDEAHWDQTLEEASISDFPKTIRQLFAILLVFYQVTDPLNFGKSIRTV